MNSAIVAAMLALGQLQGGLAGQSADGGHLHVDWRALARQRQEGRVVAHRRLQSELPVDGRDGSRLDLCRAAAGLELGGSALGLVADGSPVLVEYPAEHDGAKDRTFRETVRIVRCTDGGGTRPSEHGSHRRLPGA